jgi:esterase/lipase superfamily enzyme
MHKEIHQWHSPHLNKNMEIALYGHFGFALLMLPTAAADYLEYERFLLIDALKPLIEGGKIKVFSINSINAESWLNSRMHPEHKALRHEQFNHYVYEEVIPFIKAKTSPETPIVTTGASLGALHAANLFFKRPDLIAGTIAMSGAYDLTLYSDGFFNDTCYFNSPVHYLPGLEDPTLLSQLRDHKKIILTTGSGNYERPQATQILSEILHNKQIPHELDIWGPDMPHDWPTWRAMLPYFLSTRW